MKLLVVLLAILFGVWLWRRGRTLKAPQARGGAPGAPLPMVRCRHCGVHLPRAAAVTGRAGDYCSPAHRQEAEGG